MSKTIEVEVYKWEELSQTAKDRARNWYIEGMDYEWWEGVYEVVKEDGYDLGFCIDDIRFSGFCSQGDGASWLGQVDVGAWLKAHAPDSIGVSALIALINTGYIEKHVKVGQSHSNYCHENTMDVNEVQFDERLYYGDELDDVELEAETIEGQGIFDGMTLANVRDIINTDEANPFKLSNLSALDEAIEESAKDYAKDIYVRLREEYEYLCSEEMMLDHFECNDYHFTDEGELA
jgi:hypothetical protein